MERRVVTVLFADLVGSTTIGEELDPEVFRGLLGRYHALARDILERHGGTVEKFVGDAVLAVFGVPVIREDDAARAVRAAVELRDAVRALSMDAAGRPAASPIEMAVRVGLQTGEVVASGQGAETLVTGDVVNTAARLEQAAGPGEILAGSLTWALVRDVAKVERVAGLVLKGKLDPVDAVRIVTIDRSGDSFRRRLDMPIVGRARELATIRSVVDRAANQRQCEVVLVLAAPGVGKSRLAREAVSGLGADTIVLVARCLSYGQGMSYRPIAAAILNLAGVSEGADHATVISGLRSLVAGAEHENVLVSHLAALVGAGGGASGQEIAWAIRRTLEWLARTRPVVILFEDLHWAERPLVDLVEHIVDWSRETSITLLLTARPEFADTAAGLTSGRERVTVMHLEPLGTGATEQLIVGLSGGLVPSFETVQEIERAAEGNPLFVEQFLAMLVHDGVIRQEGGSLVLSGPLPLSAVPPSIGALLGARLDRLSQSERSTAQRASVIGRVFWWGAVSDLSPADMRSSVGQRLADLVRHELVQPAASSMVGDEGFAFRHQLIRDAAYAGLSKTARSDLHERFAAWLERRPEAAGPEVDAILGYHLEQACLVRQQMSGLRDAGLAKRAAGYLHQAASRAYDRDDPRTERGLLERLLNLLALDDPARGELLVRLARCLFRLGESDAAATAERDLDLHLAVHPNPEQQAELRLWDLEKAEVAIMREGAGLVYEAARDRGDELTMSKAAESLSWAEVLEGHMSAEAHLMERARRHAELAGDEARVRRLRVSMVNRAPQSAVPVPEARRLAEAILDDPSMSQVARAQALLSLALLDAYEHQLELARDRLANARAIADDLGAVVTLASGDWGFAMGWVELMFGDPSRAEAGLRWSTDVLRRVDQRYHLTSQAPILASCYAARGALQEAEALVEEARELAVDDDVEGQARWRSVLAEIRSRQGRQTEAIDLAQDAVSIIDDTEMLPFVAENQIRLARVLTAAGDAPGAAAAVDRAVWAADLKQAPALADLARAVIVDAPRST